MLIYVTTLSAAGLMLAIPIAAALLLTRRTRLRWVWLVAGALGFLGSQVLRVPLLATLTLGFSSGLLRLSATEFWGHVFDAAVLGLSAGLFEEGARYVATRVAARVSGGWHRWADWGVGLGHGGAECVGLGLMFLLHVGLVATLSVVGVENLPMEPEQRPQVARAVASFGAAAWYAPFGAIVERLVALPLHLLFGQLVALGVVLRRATPLVLAVAFHTLADGALVLASRLGGSATVAIVLAVILALALPGLWILRNSRPQSVRFHAASQAA